MKAPKYFIIAILFLIGTSTFAQQPMKQKIDMVLDKYGNADLKVSMTMNASMWQNWVQSFGNNPAALKREMQRAMPSYFLDDFNLDKNDMDRSWELTMKAYGVCKVDKRGNWYLETDEKDVDLTELTEHKYMYVASPLEFGGQIQQTTMIEFPEEAEGIKVDEDAYGKTVFEFDMKREKAGFNPMTGAGLLLLLIGLGWLVTNIVRKPKEA
ncbi:MAG: hypothetical protein AAF502_09140 [Bacteroidota bacterium]